MSKVDTAWLRMERPDNLMMIDLNDTYERLGLETTSGGIRMANGRPNSALRAAIMRPATAQSRAGTARDSAP